MRAKLPTKQFPVLDELPSMDTYGFPSLLTPKETSLYLRIPLPTVYYLIRMKRLPAYQIGGRWRVKRDSLNHRISKKMERDAPSAMILADDPNTQAFYRSHLKAANYCRVFVGTGEEAISCARKQKFDILFVDLNQKDMPIFEIVGGIIRLQPDMVQVVVSRSDQVSELQQALDLSPIFACSHPIKPEVILRLLRHMK